MGKYSTKRRFVTSASILASLRPHHRNDGLRLPAGFHAVNAGVHQRFDAHDFPVLNLEHFGDFPGPRSGARLLHGAAVSELVTTQRGVVIEEAEDENEPALFVDYGEAAIANQCIGLKIAGFDLVGAAEAENGIWIRGELFVVRGLNAGFDAVAIRIERNVRGMALFDRAEVAIGDGDHVLPRTPLRGRNGFGKNWIRRDEVFRPSDAATFLS